ncbi:unnamed protein product [Merluccius merluccius]
MLNIPTQAFPAAGSQQRVAAAGQSGRNKVALMPGHSLMDWIRFAKSGRDLTGLRGRLIEVTEEELKKHSKRDDCWTCIRGLVYNVTPYMDYHPGGEEELMKAAGIDGTELFDQVHRWVNYESMLKECLVGRMATKTIAVKGKNYNNDNNFIYDISDSVFLFSRYDWFQTESAVNIVVYTKRKIPSSGCTTIDLQDGVLRLEALLGKMSYMLHLPVQMACSVGKVQLKIAKQTRGKWASLGQPLECHNSFLPQKGRALHYRDCVLVSKTQVNHNTCLFRLQLRCGTVMHVPVGKHVYLKTRIQEAEVVKPYTPVDQSLVPADPLVPDQTHGSDLFLMVKVYPDGLFTPHLNTLKIGDHMLVSGPEGPFSLRPLRDVTHLYLLAAGTGFTPMARLIQLSLQDLGTIKKTKLLFFNRQEEDIMWRSEMDDLAAKDERFQVEYVLSEPRAGWTGRTGRVDQSVLRDVLGRPDGAKCYVCVCGPAAFTELTEELVRQQGFSQEEIHAFQG